MGHFEIQFRNVTENFLRNFVKITGFAEGASKQLREIRINSRKILEKQ